ncbi:PAS domain S-box protein [Thermodesulfobacteriota bacterium]
MVKSASWRNSLLFDSHGDPVGTLSSGEDVTERKRAEAALRDSEERYRNLFEQSTDAILIVRPGGEMIDANPSCAELFGAPREEIVGSNVLQYYWNPEDRTEFRSRIDKDGFTREFDWLIRRKDGTQRSCLLNSATWKDGQGAVLGYLSISRDVTESKRLEEQLLQSQKMEAVGTLSGGIAHDFNNLLQVIQGYADMALLDIGKNDSGQAELLEIKLAARSAAELTQGLLTFSRQVESRLRPVNLNRELEQVAKMLKRTIPKMISVELELAEGLCPIKADPAQLQQVVMNLAVNARDAMPDGGKITVETTNVVLDEDYCKAHLDTKPGTYVMLAVSDSGLVMGTETLERIFEPFFTTKAPGKGTGLGLAIVFGIVKSHGGNIICHSEPESGTTFKILLPAMTKEKEIDELRQLDTVVGGQETILLVDDEVAVRTVGTRILSRFGYSVLTAGDAREALSIFKKEKKRISMVILDLIMPEIGGRECMAEMMKIDPTVKVLIASGYAADGRIDEALEEGATAAIRKPYEVLQMLEIVRRVLDRE